MMKICLKLFFVILLLGMGLLLISHYVLDASSNHFLSQLWQANHRWLMGWRYLLYVVVVMSWPYFIIWMGKWQHWSPEQIRLFKHQRLKLCVLIVLVEILWVHNIF